MKNIVLSFFLVICCHSFCQVKDSMPVWPFDEHDANGIPIITKVPNPMPEFPGGNDSLTSFVRHNLKYPARERENKIEGKVIIGFIVNEDGSLSHFTVKKAISKGLSEEALRVVKLMPKWTPGKMDGKIIRVSQMLPIVFKL